MVKKTIKMVAVLMIVLMVVATLSQVALAVDFDLNQFNSYGDDSGASGSATKIIGAIINIIQIIGTGVAIIMLIVLAIKYISAAPGDKAEIKKHAVVYIVGAIVLFAASGILGIIKNFASNVS